MCMCVCLEVFMQYLWNVTYTDNHIIISQFITIYSNEQIVDTYTVYYISENVVLFVTKWYCYNTFITKK